MFQKRPQIKTISHNPNIVHLGLGRAASLGVGSKGTLLDRAARAGLRVPAGVILLDSFLRDAIAIGLVRSDGKSISVANAKALASSLNLPNFAGLIAVRSAFSAEDNPDSSMAGFFTSRLWIDPFDPEPLTQALCDVWESSFGHEGEFRRDALVMTMVNAAHSGVAFTEREFEDDLVNFIEGTADRLVSGEAGGKSMTLPKLRTWEKPCPCPERPAWAFRLQSLLKDVRKVFGRRDWDIEWADDGSRCWLIQVRPITRQTRRNEAFTLANHKEILPDLPSPFMTSVIESCAGDLFESYQQFDSELPANRPFIEVFKGRPLINLSLMTDMMRILGLPTRLVTDSIGGEPDVDYRLNAERFARKIPIFVRYTADQLWAIWRHRGLANAIVARASEGGSTFAENIETLRYAYVATVKGMFPLTAAMSIPLALLRWSGTLDEHNARQQDISTAMYNDLAPLRQLVLSDEGIRQPLSRGELPQNERFLILWNAYISKHGHRGIYESDIARPRFWESPEPLLVSLSRPVPANRPNPRRTLLAWLTLPLWWHLGRAINAREELRYQSMKGFDNVRKTFVGLAKQAVTDGQLPNEQSLWLLRIDEARRLDSGWIAEDDFIQQRQEEIEWLRGYHFPDSIYRFDDLERFQTQASADPNINRLSGVSLTVGDVQGLAWVLDEPSVVLPEGFKAEDTILVARSVDSGWIPTFSMVAGVVVETGGDLSHGSIILREIGLPAITNVQGATRQFSTGERLMLTAGSGHVERITD